MPKRALKVITESERVEEALKRSYEFMAETAVEVVLTIDADDKILFVNPAITKVAGYTPSELVGQKITCLIPGRPSRRKAGLRTVSPTSNHKKQFQTVAAGSRGLILHKDGRKVTADIAVEKFKIAGKPMAAAIIRNSGARAGVTTRKAAEEKLKASESRYQNVVERQSDLIATLVENSPDIISRLDRRLRFTYVSPAAQSQFGIPPALFIGKSVREIGVHAKDSRSFESACKNVFTSGKPEYREFFYGEKYYRTRIIPEFTETASVASVMCIDQDFTEQRRIEVELRTLSTRLLDMQDRERRRIARELHDGTAQNLFAMTIGLSRLLQQTIPPDLKGTLEECLSLCEQSRQEIRTLSYVLHPPMLDEAGLSSTLKWYTGGFSERSGIRVDLVLEPDPGRLPLEIETVLFRVVQECLANVHRHSGSALASVRLQRKTDSVILQVQDWGHGIPPEVGRAGVGIPGMRERLSQLLGHLEIESGGQGTTITATVPLVTGRGSGALYDSEKHKQSRIH